MITINIKNIDKVIKQLENYQKSLEDKQKQLLERLAEIGIEVATTRFGSAQYDGINDVVVDSEPTWIDDTKLAIVARGNAITFIEFGTGVHYTEQHPKAEELGAVRGTYGQGKGSRDSWTYYGETGTAGQIVRESEKGAVVRTQGNPPNRAMYDAGKEMRQRIIEIAKEVFGSD